MSMTITDKFILYACGFVLRHSNILECLGMRLACMPNAIVLLHSKDLTCYIQARIISVIAILTAGKASIDPRCVWSFQKQSLFLNYATIGFDPPDICLSTSCNQCAVNVHCLIVQDFHYGVHGLVYARAWRGEKLQFTHLASFPGPCARLQLWSCLVLFLTCVT